VDRHAGPLTLAGNAESHEILHPECVAITKSKVVVAYPEEDRVVHCSLIQVTAVELLPDSASRGDGPSDEMDRPLRMTS
jgi:hypothetical protein